MSAPAIQLPLGSASARRSSAAGHWFRAVFIAIGLIVASSWTVAGVFRVNDRINAFTRGSIPGEAVRRSRYRRPEALISLLPAATGR